MTRGGIVRTDISVNLPTSDLERAKKFYAGLGWRIDPNFTDENAACVVIDANIFLMVLKREFFATFTDKTVADPADALQVITTLSRPSREEVDNLIELAVAAGGTEHGDVQDFGFRYSRSFEDPDGNLFRPQWMATLAAEIGPEAFLAEQKRRQEN